MPTPQTQEFEARELAAPPARGAHYQASLFLSYGILLTLEELSSLLDHLETNGLSLWRTGVLLPEEKIKLSKGDLLKSYQKSLILPHGPFVGEEKAALSSVWSRDEKAISFCELAKDKWQVAKELPVVQLNRFQFRFDAKVEEFFTHSFSQDSIHWGIELKFPQLFIDPVSKKAVKVLKVSYPNTLLWKEIQGWVRSSTLPVKLEIDTTDNAIETSKVRVAPFRIGRVAYDLGEEMLKSQQCPFKLKRTP